MMERSSGVMWATALRPIRSFNGKEKLLWAAGKRKTRKVQSTISRGVKECISQFFLVMISPPREVLGVSSGSGLSSPRDMGLCASRCQTLQISVAWEGTIGLYCFAPQKKRTALGGLWGGGGGVVEGGGPP